MNYGHYGRDLLLELKRSSAGDVASTTGAAAAAGAGTGGGGSSTMLPAYNDALVSSALQDLRLHVRALNDQVEASAAAAAAAADKGSSGGGSSRQQQQKQKLSMNVRPSILLQNAAVQRNKRCLLAYHVERANRIKAGLYWQGQNGGDENDRPKSAGGGGGVAAKNRNPQLCPAEQVFLDSYRDLVRRYAENCGFPDGDDLRGYGAVPPLAGNERVQVRVVRPIEGGGGGGDDKADDDVVLNSGATAVLSTVGSTHYLLWDDVEEYVRTGHLSVLEVEE